MCGLLDHKQKVIVNTAVKSSYFEMVTRPFHGIVFGGGGGGGGCQLINKSHMSKNILAKYYVERFMTISTKCIICFAIIFFEQFRL